MLHHSEYRGPLGGAWPSGAVCVDVVCVDAGVFLITAKGIVFVSFARHSVCLVLELGLSAISHMCRITSTDALLVAYKRVYLLRGGNGSNQGPTAHLLRTEQDGGHWSVSVCGETGPDHGDFVAVLGMYNGSGMRALWGNAQRGTIDVEQRLGAGKAVAAPNGRLACRSDGVGGNYIRGRHDVHPVALPGNFTEPEFSSHTITDAASGATITVADDGNQWYHITPETPLRTDFISGPLVARCGNGRLVHLASGTSISFDCESTRGEDAQRRICFRTYDGRWSLADISQTPPAICPHPLLFMNAPNLTVLCSSRVCDSQATVVVTYDYATQRGQVCLYRTESLAARCQAVLLRSGRGWREP